MLQMLYEGLNLGELDVEDWDRIRAVYLGMCMKVDQLFGRVVAVLKEEGLYDATDLYFFSDHGDFTGDYGLVCKAQNLMPDCLTGVPLLIKPHAGVAIDPGLTDSMAELVDFYATALDLAEIESDHTHFGRSLRPVLADRTARVREFVCCEGGRTRDELLQCSETQGTRPDRHELFWPRKTAQMDDVAHTKATMIRTDSYKYVRRLYELDEFYNLRLDPGESINEINNPDYAQQILDLKLQMLDWYQATTDIVPREMDASISVDMILARVRNQLTPERFAEFAAETVASGGVIGPMIALCERYGVRALI